MGVPYQQNETVTGAVFIQTKAQRIQGGMEDLLLQAIAAALAAGGRPKMEPTDINIGGNFPARIAFVYGPDDEVIEFFMER